MSIDILLHTLSNSVIFGVCTWAILSHKIHDGVIIKAGLILAAFAALGNMDDMNPTPPDLVMSIGVALACAGAFLRVEVYPRYLKNIYRVCTICSSIHSPKSLKRRVTDKERSNDVHTGAV